VGSGYLTDTMAANGMKQLTQEWARSDPRPNARALPRGRGRNTVIILYWSSVYSQSAGYVLPGHQGHSAVIPSFKKSDSAFIKDINKEWHLALPNNSCGPTILFQCYVLVNLFLC